MAGERGKRIYRKATNDEKQRHSRVREQIANELPEIKRRARDRLSKVVGCGTPLRQVLSALRSERERLGLSLNDIFERTGIDRAALSRLENNENANPTLGTLERYAEALDKQILVVLSDVKPKAR